MILIYILIGLFLVLAVLMSLLVLLQRGRGGGLIGALGGGGGHSAFGTKTTDILTKITYVFGATLFLLSIVTAITLHHMAAPQIEARQEEADAQADPSAPADGQAPAPDADTGDVAPPADMGTAAPAPAPAAGDDGSAAPAPVEE